MTGRPSSDAAALSVDATVLSSADADLCAAAARQGLHVAKALDHG